MELLISPSYVIMHDRHRITLRGEACVKQVSEGRPSWDG